MSRSANNGHVSHYPLDIPGATPFERYSHIPVTELHLLVADILQDFMYPSPEMAQLYGSPIGSHTDLAWDVALRKLQQVDPPRFKAITSLHGWPSSRSPLPYRGLFGAGYTLGDIVLSAVERFHREMDCISFHALSVSTYFARVMSQTHPRPVPNTEKTRGKFLGGDFMSAVNWDRKQVGFPRAEGNTGQQPKEHVVGLYDGKQEIGEFTRDYHMPHGLHPRARPIYDRDAGFMYTRRVHWPRNRYGRKNREFVQFPLLFRDGEDKIRLETDQKRWRGRGAHRIPREGDRGRRCFSEPPPRLWSSIIFIGVNVGREIPVPAMKLSQLDKKSRRRSLSRGRIQDMFDWDLDLRQRNNKPRNPAVEESTTEPRCFPCENCSDEDHTMSECAMPCGHCGHWSPGEYEYFQDMIYANIIEEELLPDEEEERHFAPDCPAARNNRCKCLPFPVYHTAKRCYVKCRPGCGHPNPEKHRGNAMTCTYRCCMCGIRNSHAGRDCRLKRCRCGGYHLGQDHSWNPTCRAPDCDKYLCGVHCQSCFSTERPFDEETRKCWKCQGLEKRPEVWGREGEKKRRRWERKVEDVKQLFASGSNGAGGQKEKGQADENGTGNKQNGTQGAKVGGGERKSIFGDAGVRADGACQTPMPDEA
ncbi:hypothetical protein QBC40DRAFT_278988 [Triangularia verruculosa]|uniref:Uncharacterized protein n=1 Tax=Triangularia verruculosa TaxID=2587418 RepID=A0AAN7ATY3_9PEZI|nr:hypothetical protein QBC40DRAFT_278988 [Triangularia verruculosa]